MIDFDFLPPEYHHRRDERRRLRRCAALVGVMLLAMGGWIGAHAAAMRRATRLLADVEQQRSQVQIHRVHLEMLTQERDSLAAREKLRALLEDEASFSVTLAALSRALPAGVALTELEFTRPGATTQPAETRTDRPPVPPAATQPARLDLLPLVICRGVGSDVTAVSDFAAGLAGSAFFADVSTRERPAPPLHGRHGDGFELSCRVLRQAGGAK
ncbi:MAG: hypothetical protein U1A27_08730 [Phycisphaerae bacterium]